MNTRHAIRNLTVVFTDGAAVGPEADAASYQPRRARTGSIRSFVVFAVATLAIMAFGSTAAYGQLAGMFDVLGGNNPGGGHETGIEVHTVNNLQFSCLRRNETESIGYSSVNAGQFEIEGKAGRQVRIRLAVSDVKLDGNQMGIVIRPSDVAYSTDGGFTWRQFTNVNLDAVTRFPNAPHNQKSKILVRIGGTLTSGAGQERGQYQGSIRLSANYE